MPGFRLKAFHATRRGSIALINYDLNALAQAASLFLN